VQPFEPDFLQNNYEHKIFSVDMTLIGINTCVKMHPLSPYPVRKLKPGVSGPEISKDRLQVESLNAALLIY
jgi:hypothetical protein